MRGIRHDRVYFTAVLWVLLARPKGNFAARAAIERRGFFARDRIGLSFLSNKSVVFMNNMRRAICGFA
jgi:hypothetical protein